MNRETFLEKEYQTIRKEIEDTHNRMFQILVGGSTVVPAAQILLPKDASGNLGVIAAALPFVVIVMVLIFLSQNLAMMRCGLYIKEHIEPAIPNVLGWEMWMERNPRDLRAHDTFVKRSFYALSFVYYLVSSVMGVNAVAKFANDMQLQLPIPFLSMLSLQGYGIVEIVMTLVYVGFGIWTAGLLRSTAKASHSTSARRRSRIYQRSYVARFLRRGRGKPEVLQFLEEAINAKLNAMVRNPEPPAELPHQRLKQAFTVFCHAFSDIDATVEHVVAEGDEFVIQVKLSGIHHKEWLSIPATNKTIDGLPAFWIQRIVDGRVVDEWGELDPQDVLQELSSMSGRNWRRGHNLDLITSHSRGVPEHS